jgi:prepilin-type N-terminal cleavage/methylation domain-containing protein
MMYQTKRPFRLGKQKSRRGFTLVELMIATAITSLVMVAVAALQYISGRFIVETYGQTRTRSSRMRAIDQIYYRLCDARSNSTITSQGGRRIDFTDPGLGGHASSFSFDTGTKSLYYDDDVSDGKPAIGVVNGPIDITFESQAAGALTVLRVKSASQMSRGDVDTQEGQTSVYLRNPMAP